MPHTAFSLHSLLTGAYLILFIGSVFVLVSARTQGRINVILLGSAIFIFLLVTTVSTGASLTRVNVER
jgi:hypothetical protein